MRRRSSTARGTNSSLEPAGADGVTLIVRVVLFGGLTTLLVGLVALGAVLIVDRRVRPLSPAEEESDEPEPPPPSVRPKSRERRLPSLVMSECAPKPGRACWRGRLRLSAAVRAAWLAARGAKRATAVRDGDDDIDDGVRGHVTAIDSDDADDGDLAGGEPGDPAAIDVSAGPPDPAGDRSVALPPEGSFAAFFKVKAVPWDDQPDDSMRAAVGVSVVADAGSVDPPELDEVVARLSPDGTFDLDVLPGRYDVVATADDNLLLGGIDGLDARAGDGRDNLDLALVAPVALAGRLLDDDGVSVAGTLEVRRPHNDEVVAFAEPEQGRFLVDGLRPGPYILVATSRRGSPQTIETRAPLSGIELRFARLPAALLLVGAANDSGDRGRCMSGRILLTSQDAERERRGVWMQGCQAVLLDVRPGSTWRATGKLGFEPKTAHAVDTVIGFGTGKPLLPVCLDGGCRADTAAAFVRVIDSDGDAVHGAAVEVLSATDEALAPGMFLGALTQGLRAGATLTLRARVSDLQATATVWLAAGVNDVLIRLPGRVPN